MKCKLANAFDELMPSPDELWARGGASIESIEIEPGHCEAVPFFDLEIIDNKQLSIDNLEIKDGRQHRKIGQQVLSQIKLSDGIERLTRVITIDDKYRSDGNFTVTDGTAWTTTINGYTHDRARRIAKASGAGVIQIGAEHSGSVIPLGFDGLRLGRTLLQARSISLAKAAQAEQLIISQLTDDYGLGPDQYAIGDSRASMKTPGQFPYAEIYGNRIIHIDTKAPCVPERLGPHDAGRVIRWLGVEAVGGSGVIMQLACEGKLGTLVGTISGNPNYLASSIIGTVPALASGEAGRMVSWVPRTAHGQVVVYGHDGLSLGSRWQELWQDHPDIHVKSLPRKIHTHLLESKAHDQQIGRIKRFSQELDSHGADLSEIDWSRVYRSPGQDSDTSLRVA